MRGRTSKDIEKPEQISVKKGGTAQDEVDRDAMMGKGVRGDSGAGEE